VGGESRSSSPGGKRGGKGEGGRLFPTLTRNRKRSFHSNLPLGGKGGESIPPRSLRRKKSFITKKKEGRVGVGPGGRRIQALSSRGKKREAVLFLDARERGG